MARSGAGQKRVSLAGAPSMTAKLSAASAPWQSSGTPASHVPCGNLRRRARVRGARARPGRTPAAGLEVVDLGPEHLDREAVDEAQHDGLRHHADEPPALQQPHGELEQPGHEDGDAHGLDAVRLDERLEHERARRRRARDHARPAAEDRARRADGDGRAEADERVRAGDERELRRLGHDGDGRREARERVAGEVPAVLARAQQKVAHLGHARLERPRGAPRRARPHLLAPPPRRPAQAPPPRQGEGCRRQREEEQDRSAAHG